MTHYNYERVSVHTFAVLLVSSLHETLVTIAREATAVTDIGTHTVGAMISVLAFVQVDALGVVEFVEHHTFVARAVEAAFEVVTHTAFARVRTTTLVNICERQKKKIINTTSYKVNKHDFLQVF